jgi:phage-related minor tail protein
MKSNQEDEVKALGTQTTAEFSGEILQATHVFGPSFDSTTELGERDSHVGGV